MQPCVLTVDFDGLMIDVSGKSFDVDGEKVFEVEEICLADTHIPLKPRDPQRLITIQSLCENLLNASAIMTY